MKNFRIKSLKKYIEFLERVIIIITSSLMVLLTAVVFFNVITRYFFNLPIAFTYELVDLLFPWIVFMAIINVTYENENIDILFFVKLFPNTFQTISKYFVKLVMLFFSIYIMMSGFRLASAVGNHTLPLLKISKSWLYWSVAYSFIGVSLIIVYQIILLITGEEDVGEGGEELDMGNDH